MLFSNQLTLTWTHSALASSTQTCSTGLDVSMAPLSMSWIPSVVAPMRLDYQAIKREVDSLHGGLIAGTGSDKTRFHCHWKEHKYGQSALIVKAVF